MLDKALRLPPVLKLHLYKSPLLMGPYSGLGLYPTHKTPALKFLV